MYYMAHAGYFIQRKGGIDLDEKSSIGKKIKLLRVEKNLTQIEFSKQIKISPSSLSSWETGKGYPAVSTLLKICRFFDVEINTFCGEQNASNRNN